MGYIRFILQNPRFLAYGWLLSFGSSFGQTYFVGLFGDHIREEFAINHGEFGLLYSIATIIAGISIAWIGKRVDEVDLRPYTLGVLAGLACACVLMAVAEGVVLLLVCFLMLRLFGQGLMSHTSTTAMARYFGRNRGKAMSFASLGMTTGEALIPLVLSGSASIFAGVIVLIGWRETWWLSAAVVVLFFMPFTQWLLKGHGERDRILQVEMAASETGASGEADGRQWTRGEVLRHSRFYLQLPGVIAAPMLLTGLFIHQAHIFNAKGWPHEWIGTCFLGFAVAKVIGALGIGPMIDRFGTIRLLPWFMPPMAVGMLAIGLFDHPFAAMIYMTLSGIAVGSGIGIIGAMWAEIYGVRHVGAIRAMVSAIMMFSTSLAPLGFGLMFDLGISVDAIAIGCAVYTLAGTVLLYLTAGPQPQPATRDIA